MIAAHAPIQTRPAQRTPLLRKCLDVDPKLQTELSSLRGEFESLVSRPQVAPLFKTVKDKHTQFTRKMVIANARLSQRGFSGAGANPYCAYAIGNTHETFKKLGHVGLGETKIAMPALPFHSQQLRLEQLGEVRADSLLCYPRHLREFSRG